MSGPSTPYLCVDGGILRANIARVADRVRAAGVRLRPHVKTHKCPRVADLQREAGATGITVATIGEAEAFVAAGHDDVFIAYPLWLDDVRAGRLRRLTETGSITIGVDSVEAAVHNATLLTGAPIRVLVEVDSGHHRSGCAPDEAGRIAAAAAEAGLTVDGVFTFPGHGYSPTERALAAAQEAAALGRAGAALEAEGIQARVLSGGSTPTLEEADLGVVTEYRPGVYVFGDAQQWELGTMRPDQIALTCVATVVSHAGGRAVLDAGSKALGADRAAYATGFGRLIDHPEARLVQLSEHHAVADLAGRPLPPLGATVRVVPNHVCNAVNLHDELWVRDADGLAPWPVTARGRNH